jgi:V/A-type H+-transporting ATPase subunit C
MLENKHLKYAYSNARVRAMRTLLLSRAQVAELVDVEGASSVVELLERTPYKDDLVSLSLKFKGPELVELALAKNFARTAQKLVRITPEQDRPVVEAMLKRWDVHNIRTVLMAKYLGKPAAELEAFVVPAGRLQQKEIKAMADADGLEAAVAAIGATEYGSVLKRALKQNKTIHEMLAELDRYYFETMSERIMGMSSDPQVGEMLRSEIDARNIMNVLRCKRARMEPRRIRELIIAGGNLPRQKLVDMSEDDDTESAAAEIVKHYPLQKALDRYREDRSLARLEIALESMIAERSLKTLQRSILSLGAIVGFLYLKEQEIGNVRKVMRGKEFGMEKEKIKEMIVAAA